MSALSWVEPGLVPLIGRAVSRGVFGGGCELGLAVNNLPAMQELQETRVQSLGEEDPLEKEMATHSSTLACRIPWAEEPGGLQSTGSQESDTTGRLDHRRSSSGAAHLGSASWCQFTLLLALLSAPP